MNGESREMTASVGSMRTCEIWTDKTLRSEREGLKIDYFAVQQMENRLLTLRIFRIARTPLPRKTSMAAIHRRNKDDDFAICIYTILPCSNTPNGFRHVDSAENLDRLAFFATLAHFFSLLPSTSARNLAHFLHSNKCCQGIRIEMSHTRVSVRRFTLGVVLQLSFVSHRIACIFDKSILSESEVVAITFSRGLDLLQHKQHLGYTAHVRPI